MIDLCSYYACGFNRFMLAAFIVLSVLALGEPSLRAAERHGNVQRRYSGSFVVAVLTAVD